MNLCVFLLGLHNISLDKIIYEIDTGYEEQLGFFDLDSKFYFKSKDEVKLV